MVHKLRLRKHFGAIVFIAIVLVSGGLLAASGNLQNPLNAVTELSQLVSGTTGERGAMSRGTPPDSETRGAPPSGARGEGGEQSGFQWNQLGSVLYNAWVIAAATVLVMLVGPLLGRGIKQMEHIISRLRPARASATS